MESLKIYDINANYIDYLLPFAPHLFHNSKKAAAPLRSFFLCRKTAPSEDSAVLSFLA